jgi:hypothetical protein
VFSYRVMSLFFQQGQHLREYFERAFDRIGDLQITEVVRIPGESPDALPADLGKDSLGNGERWSVSEVIRRGRISAVDAGIDSPDEATCIRRGLLEAARINPIRHGELSSDGSAAVVRLALFDGNDDVTKVDPQVGDLIKDRILNAVDRHLDESREEFRHWFFESVDNIVHQVAKQKKIAKVATRQLVGRVLCDLAFDSFRYVGQCVHVAMRAFRGAMPNPLSVDEERLFDFLYSCHSWLADLPVILLRPRFHQLREILIEMMTNPEDTQLIGVLQRLLVYYGEMAAARRRADRDYRRRSHHQNDRGRTAVNVQLRDDDGTACDDQTQEGDSEPDECEELCREFTDRKHVFQKTAHELRGRRGSNCRCGHHDHWSARLIESKTNDEIVTIVDRCKICGHHEEIGIPKAQFEAVAHWINDGSH